MKIIVIDGQGGKMGHAVIVQLKKSHPELEITAIGTNSIATSSMLKAGADAGATGENPVVVASRSADIIIRHRHRNPKLAARRDHSGHGGSHRLQPG